MSKILEGQVIVVTGGAGRIGRAFCKAIAREGGLAVIADTDIRKAEECALEIRNTFGISSALGVHLNITDSESIDTNINKLHQQFGKITAVVNNAYPRNSNYGKIVEEVTYESFAENVSQHTGGYFLTSQRFARYFKDQGCGNVVIMGSVYGLIAPRFEIYNGTDMTMPVEYAVIKAGLLHLTRYLAQYYKGFGVRVNSLSPGGVFNNQDASFIKNYSANTMGNRMLSPVDLEGTLLYLLSPASAHVTGQNITVDDGWTL
jgi:NAD(P)-dependent dehydrogenase (short-subunit alcohol dehydrogenase family)